MKKIYGLLLGMAFLVESIYKFSLTLEDFRYSIPEPTIKQKFKHNKTFYQEPILKQNILNYNKSVPRSGKKIRGEYVSMQSRARDRREKIKKTLEGKI
jgi:hypothetical protein